MPYNEKLYKDKFSKQTFPYLSTLLFFIMKKFSLFEEFNTNLETISDIDNCIKITLGPTGKKWNCCRSKGNLTFITSGSLLMKSLDFPTSAGSYFEIIRTSSK
jgi:hypothetical protein